MKSPSQTAKYKAMALAKLKAGLIKCECDNVATHVTGSSYSCDRCKAIENKLHNFHHQPVGRGSGITEHRLLLA